MFISPTALPTKRWPGIRRVVSATGRYGHQTGLRGEICSRKSVVFATVLDHVSFYANYVVLFATVLYYTRDRCSLLRFFPFFFC